MTFYCTGKPCKAGHEIVRYVYNYRCLQCRRDRENARIAQDRAKHAAKGRAWYAKHPETCRARNRAYRAKNPEYHRKKSEEWRRANPEHYRECVRQWKAANPEADRIYVNNRRVRKLGNGGTHTRADVAEIFKAQKGRCAYCKVKLGKKREVDHIKPVARGGTNNRSNLQILCAPCNSKKRAKDPITFAQSLGMLL